MKASRITNDDAETVIKWEERGEFGHLTFRYNEKGTYFLDAEYIGIDRIIEIIKAVI